MSVKNPPVLADWLLNRLRIPETNAPLAGDLAEEFQNGRSRAWYWRQTLVAVASQLRHNARATRWNVGAIFVSWLAQTGVAYLLWRQHLPGPVRPGYLPAGALVCVASVLAFRLLLNEKQKAGLLSFLYSIVRWGARRVLDATISLPTYWA